MSRWIRVSRRLVCPVCGRPDWCLLAMDGTVAICARVESAKRCGEAGWLHRLTAQPVVRPRRRLWPIHLHVEPRAGSQDIAALSRLLQAESDRGGAIERLSQELGLTPQSLISFGVGWSQRDRYSSWPMFDDRRRIVGINRRFANGTKKILAGHRAGLYMPADLPQDLACVEGMLLVTEGATDAVAARDLGFWAVGRFSCTHGAGLLVGLVSRIRPARLVLVGDSDRPGGRGVSSLASVLTAYVRRMKVIFPPPPHKDLRAWKQAGATSDDVMRAVDAARSCRLSVEVGHG